MELSRTINSNTEQYFAKHLQFLHCYKILKYAYWLQRQDYGYRSKKKKKTLQKTAANSRLQDVSMKMCLQSDLYVLRSMQCFYFGHLKIDSQWGSFLVKRSYMKKKLIYLAPDWQWKKKNRNKWGYSSPIRTKQVDKNPAWSHQMVYE